VRVSKLRGTWDEFVSRVPSIRPRSVISTARPLIFKELATFDVSGPSPTKMCAFEKAK
jgi:hypothetical protein